MVDILSTVLTDGLSAVGAACAKALSNGVHSADIIINILARHRDPDPPTPINTPDALKLRCEPVADCARYDRGHEMERTEVLDMMGTLKLYGMKAAYDEVVTTAVKRQHEPSKLIGSLLAAEISEKQARSIKYQMTITMLPLAKEIPSRRCMHRLLGNG